MTIRRAGAGLAAVILASTGLAACGGGDQAYCDGLESAMDTTRSALAGADPSDTEAYDQARSAVAGIVDNAPDEVEAEWKTVADLVDSLATQADLDTLSGKVDEVQSASEKIVDDAKERCGVDLAP